MYCWIRNSLITVSLHLKRSAVINNGPLYTVSLWCYMFDVDFVHLAVSVFSATVLWASRNRIFSVGVKQSCQFVLEDLHSAATPLKRVSCDGDGLQSHLREPVGRELSQTCCSAWRSQCCPGTHHPAPPPSPTTQNNRLSWSIARLDEHFLGSEQCLQYWVERSQIWNRKKNSPMFHAVIFTFE